MHHCSWIISAKISADLWPDRRPRGPRGAEKGEKVWQEFTIAAFKALQDLLICAVFAGRDRAVLTAALRTTSCETVQRCFSSLTDTVSAHTRSVLTHTSSCFEIDVRSFVTELWISVFLTVQAQRYGSYQWKEEGVFAEHQSEQPALPRRRGGGALCTVQARSIEVSLPVKHISLNLFWTEV